MSALFELPDMSSTELEQFLEENLTSLSLTLYDCTALRVRRRRRSLLRHVAVDEPIAAQPTSSPSLGRGSRAHKPPFEPYAALRIVVLGDDCSSKFALVRQLYAVAGQAHQEGRAQAADDALSAALAKHVSGVLEVRSLSLSTTTHNTTTKSNTTTTIQRSHRFNVEVFVPHWARGGSSMGCCSSVIVVSVLPLRGEQRLRA